MRRLYAIWDRVDVRLHYWLVRHSVALLRIALGGIFLGFGVLTRGLIPAGVARVLIAVLECAIGLCFLTGKGLRVGVWLLAVQLLGALSPLLLFSGEMFSGPHHAPSLEGQYVIKDVVLIGAGLVIATTVRGGRLIAGPKGTPRVAHAMPRDAAESVRPAMLTPARRHTRRAQPADVSV